MPTSRTYGGRNSARARIKHLQKTGDYFALIALFPALVHVL